MKNKRVLLYLTGLVIGVLYAMPTSAAINCSGVVIDNDASDWAGIEALVTDGQDITGTTYYYDGSIWSDTVSDNTLYSTNVDMMSDMETVKVCNSATQLQLYIDAFHPLLGYQDIASGDYFEFGDSNGPDGELTLPANLDFWLVFKLQKVDSNKIYYYVIYLRAQAGDLGLENGPTQTAIYEESDRDTDFTSATFDPETDELLVEIEAENGAKKVQGDSGKQIDPSGGFETDVALMNSDGTGFFNLTNIAYGDQLRVMVQTYNGADFDFSLAPASNTASDETDSARYRVKRIGVDNVSVPKRYRESNQVRVQWSAIDEADSYSIRLMSRTGQVISTTKTSKLNKTLSELTANHRYQVKVRAKIGELYTTWSDAVSFRTAE